MPLIRPEIQKALRDVGLEKPAVPEGTIAESLTSAGLSDSELAEELVGLAKNSGNEALRLRALEIAAKIKGALKETTPPIPVFNITIQSCAPGMPQHEVNPILFPRRAASPSSLSLEDKEKEPS